jgi:hypothetical protein
MDVYSAARASSQGISLPDGDSTVVTLISIEEMDENESNSELEGELLEEPPEVEFASVHGRRRKGLRPFLRLIQSPRVEEETKVCA